MGYDGGLWDDVESLSIGEVRWCVGEFHVRDWVEDQPDLRDGKSWERISEVTPGGSHL